MRWQTAVSFFISFFGKIQYICVLFKLAVLRLQQLHKAAVPQLQVETLWVPQHQLAQPRRVAQFHLKARSHPRRPQNLSQPPQHQREAQLLLDQVTALQSQSKIQPPRLIQLQAQLAPPPITWAPQLIQTHKFILHLCKFCNLFFKTKNKRFFHSFVFKTKPSHRRTAELPKVMNSTTNVSSSENSTTYSLPSQSSWTPSYFFSNPAFLFFFCIVLILAVLVIVGNVIRHIREMRRRQLATMEIQIWEALLNEAASMPKSNESGDSTTKTQRYIIIPRNCTWWVTVS